MREPARDGRARRIPAAPNHLIQFPFSRLGGRGVADDRIDKGDMPIGKRDPGAGERSMCEFLQGPPACVIPRMAGQFGTPEIRRRIQQLDQTWAVVLVRRERVVVETEALLHVTLLKMSKSEVPAQMAAKAAVPRILVEPGTKKGDGGVGLASLIIKMRQRMCAVAVPPLLGYGSFDEGPGGRMVAEF